MHKFLFLLLIFFLIITNSFGAHGLNGYYYKKDPYCADRIELKKQIDSDINFYWNNQPICAPFDGIGSTYAVNRNDNWGVVWSGYVDIPEGKRLVINRGVVSAKVLVDENTKYDTIQKGCGNPADDYGVWSYNTNNPSKISDAYRLENLTPGLHKIKIYTFIGVPVCNDRHFSLMFEDTQNTENPPKPVPTDNLYPYLIAKISFEKDFYSIQEPKNNTTTLNIPITLSTPLTNDITITLGYKDNTAKMGADYKPTKNTVTIPSGQLSAVVPIEIYEDKFTTDTKKTFDIEIISISHSKSTQKDTGDEIGEILINPIKLTTVQITDTFQMGECIVENKDDLNPSGYGWKWLYARTTNGTITATNDTYNNFKNISLSWNTETRNNGTKRLTINHGAPGTIGGLTNDNIGTKNNGINIIDSKTNIEFDYYAWGGERGIFNGEEIIQNWSGIKTEIKQDGGQGLAVVLYDAATKDPSLSYSIEGLGYSGTTSQSKFTNGLLAIGLHQTQDFAQNTNGLSGGVNNMTNSITIRGAANQSAPLIVSKAVGNKLGDGNPTTNDYHAGKFNIIIDTMDGKAEITVLRNGKTIIDKQNIKSYLPSSGKFKIAFVSTSKRYGNSNAHQIANISIKSSDCAGVTSAQPSIRVVEREFAEAYKNDSTKYNIDWLLNSPLRTKIAGGAPLSPYEIKTDKEHIGYEYCVVSKDIKADIYVAAKIMNEDGKTYSNFNLTSPTYDEKGRIIAKASDFVNTTENELKLNIDPAKPLNACFVLKSEYTKKSPTREFRFLVGFNDKKDVLIGDVNPNNSFAIRPAGFYMTFSEVDENSNAITQINPSPYDFSKSQLISKTTDSNANDNMLMPINQIARQKLNGKIYDEYNPLNLYVDLNSTANLKTSTYYKVNLQPTSLEIYSKDGNDKNTIYKYQWKLLNTYNKTISYKIDNKKNITNDSFSYGIMHAENNNSCTTVDNIPLGKINNDKYVLSFDNNGKLSFNSSIDDEISKFTKDTTDYLINYDNNLMRFRNDIIDSTYALNDYIKVAQYNGIKFDNIPDLTIEDKTNLENEIKNYGYRCKGYNIDNTSIVANKNFEDELVPCNIEVVNPKYTKFIPSIFDVYFMHVINANEINKSAITDSGFTFMNNIFADNPLNIKDTKENDMSAKLELIVAPVNSKGEIFSNFNNKCYSSDLNIKLNYIGDRNIRYKADSTTSATNEITMLRKYNKIFDETFKNESTAYKYFYTKTINPLTLFNEYIKNKQTYMSDSLKINIKSDPVENESELYTKKITFNIDNFYVNDKSKNTDAFCPTEKIKIITTDPATNTPKEREETRYLCDNTAIISDYILGSDYEFDWKNNYNENRKTYRKNKIKKADGFKDFEFATKDNFDEQYFRFKIGRDFFNNNEMKYFDSKRNIATLATLGSAPIFVSFNFNKSYKNPSNPIAAFTRDFAVTDIVLTNIIGEKTIEDFTVQKINLKYLPNTGDDKSTKAMIYDSMAYAPDYNGPASGYNGDVYFVTHCDANPISVCSNFRLNTDPTSSVGMLKSSWKNISYIIENKADATDMKLAINQKDNITYSPKDQTTKIIDEANDKISKSVIKSDVLNFSSTHDPLPFTDIVTINSPSYLMRMSEILNTPLNNFNVTFESISNSSWFGEGGVGNKPEDSSVGKVLGTDDNAKFKKENNPTKRSNRINW